MSRTSCEWNKAASSATTQRMLRHNRELLRCALRPRECPSRRRSPEGAAGRPALPSHVLSRVFFLRGISISARCSSWDFCLFSSEVSVFLHIANPGISGGTPAHRAHLHDHPNADAEQQSPVFLRKNHRHNNIRAGGEVPYLMKRARGRRLNDVVLNDSRHILTKIWCNHN